MGIEERNSPYIVGIDLGTSNSAIAVYVKEKAEIIPIEGRKTLPSVVSIIDKETILVGQPARSRLFLDPDNTVTSVKREMGNGNWKKEFKNLPGKEYTPTDISTEILSKLVASAQQSSMEILRGTPRYAIICIPANFDDSQKQATIEAGKLANLEVIQLIEEPVAAAIAYALEKERDQTILVYDLGGGTFDVSILKVDSTQENISNFKILSKEGVSKLGGDDFDYKIMEIAAQKFKEQSGIDILDIKKDQGISVKALRETQQKLKDKAETAKCELSEAQAAQISIPNLIKDESGNIYNLEIAITRSEFNEAIRPLLLQSIEATKKALLSAKLTSEDVSRIILVGGSTRVPLVREILFDIFKKEPYGDIDPDTVVAQGAASFAATFELPEIKPQLDHKLVIDNIVTHFLGIESQGGKFSCLIEKDLSIPTDKPLEISKEYTTQRDNQTNLRINVYQSNEHTEFVKTEGVKLIGEFHVSRIPSKPKGQEKIIINFALDQQNLLKVTAKSTTSTAGGELEINRF